MRQYSISPFHVSLLGYRYYQLKQQVLWKSKHHLWYLPSAVFLNRAWFQALAQEVHLYSVSCTEHNMLVILPWFLLLLISCDIPSPFTHTSGFPHSVWEHQFKRSDNQECQSWPLQSVIAEVEREEAGPEGAPLLENLTDWKKNEFVSISPNSEFQKNCFVFSCMLCLICDLIQNLSFPQNHQTFSKDWNGFISLGECCRVSIFTHSRAWDYRLPATARNIGICPLNMDFKVNDALSCLRKYKSSEKWML